MKSVKQRAQGDAGQHSGPGGWLGALYEAHFRELSVFARRKVGDGPPEPEDIVQHAFARIAAHRAPETIENKRAFLYRTVANYISTCRRNVATHRRHTQQAGDTQEIFGESDGLSPERVLLNKEDILRAQEAIRKLPRQQRQLLLLNRVEGISYAALARRYKVSEPTIRRRVLAAVNEVAKAVPGYAGDEGAD